MRKKFLGSILLLGLLAYGTGPAGAAIWYVNPKGTAQGKGTEKVPWDIESTLLGRKEVQPGDTVYLLGGTYRRRPREKFEVKLAGEEKKVIHVRPAPGQHVIIDGGLEVHRPSAHLWVWNLEVLVSEPDTSKTNPVQAGSHPEEFQRPWGGLHVYGGERCKFINLVIHDCRQGVSLWSGARDTELHGCVIYDNGWTGTDRGHGHGIYTQNKDGLCVLSDCILTGGRAYSLHAYGSARAFVDNYHVEGNIVYHSGPFLIGGGRPSHGIRVLNNYLYGVGMQLGYGAPYNVDCEVRGNVIVAGGLSINRFKKVVQEGNLIVRPGAKPPAEPLVVLRANKYDPDRAHLAVFTWGEQPTAAVNLGAFLKPGEGYRLYDPRHLFGKALLEGRHDGGPVDIPVRDGFAALVVLRRR